MLGSGYVTINDRKWQVLIATTTTDIIQGLSGEELLTPNTGMLFDLGYDCERIVINMQEMLFPLDIVFINSSRGVVDVALNIQPEEDIGFNADDDLGARYFLEINAGEADGVEIGNDVTLELPISNNQIIQPQFWGAILSFAVAAVAIPVINTVASKATGYLEEKFVKK